MNPTDTLARDALTAGSSPVADGPGQFHLEVPDGWQQGRGAFGGLVLAAMVRALEAAEPDRGRVVRSVNAEIAGPVLPGAARIAVRELRRGSGLSCWTGEMSQGGSGLVHASAVLAKARNTDAPRLHVAPPAPAPWREIDPLPLDGAPFVPVFTKHVEFRTTGPLPFSGGSEPTTAGWVRFKEAPASLGAAEIVALADTFWPASLTTQTTPRPMATVAFALQYFPPQTPLDPSEPVYYRARVLADQDGYLMEQRELWSTGMALLALNEQTIAWIR